MATARIAVKNMKEKMPSLEERIGYSYEGPENIGSLVAHQCAALGLFSDKEHPLVTVRVIAKGAGYELVMRIVSSRGEVLREYKDQSLKQHRAVRSLVIRMKEDLRMHLGIEKSPWGHLVGVRPMKYYYTHKKGRNSKELRDLLLHEEGVSEDKIQLLEMIAKEQETILLKGEGKRKVSLYAGIPFCTTHCTYCSFPFGLIQNYSDMHAFIDAYLKDIAHMKRMIETYKLEVISAYMGGGTPTSLQETDFQEVLFALQELIPKGIEFTVEAGRPDTLSLHKIESMEKAGVNRISINPQSMQDEVLRAIGRGHSAQDIYDMYIFIREMTSLSVNMDFIAGLPYQTREDMQQNMDFVCQMRPSNVTIHTLALKKESPLYTMQHVEHMPSTEDVRYMVDMARERLIGAGYIPYYLYRQQYMRSAMENIGYAKPQEACEYNIHMMEERGSILSIGPRSSSKWIGKLSSRYLKQYMPKDVDVYIRTLDALLAKREALCETFYGRD